MNPASEAEKHQQNVGFFSEQTTPFFNKGRGRSLMLSDFLVSHPKKPFFQLSQSEWATAVAQYPELMEDNLIEYIERSASASIQVDHGAYFDNDAGISQFTRLFKMLPFKEAYKNHLINIVVDNTRTDSAKEFSLENFGMKLGTRCPVDQIKYTDDKGQQQKLDCYFTTGKNMGKSKGLQILAEELKIKVPAKVTLKDLKQLLSSHNAFQNHIAHKSAKIDHFTPTTNNALDATNNVIKQENTIRERLPLSRFKVLAFEIVKKWGVGGSE
ncbi:unnamed protein product [Rotaria socialis]|uniref:Uncharacterized protein n=1 Tax=Rotaria socialis TaxID=392032 RepID=A0A818EIY4_9BILA|nr:unnamed protein product [Rotaria socialis]